MLTSLRSFESNGGRGGREGGAGEEEERYTCAGARAFVRLLAPQEAEGGREATVIQLFAGVRARS